MVRTSPVDLHIHGKRCPAPADISSCIRMPISCFDFQAHSKSELIPEVLKALNAVTLRSDLRFKEARYDR